MATTQVKVEGRKTKSELQTIIQQQEGLFGPLAKLDSANGYTIVTLTVGRSPDKGKRVVLEIFDGPHPPGKAGYKIVCSGKCLIASALTQIVAYRAT